MHHDYQHKLEELSQKNVSLIEMENKYQSSIRQLSDNVASLNV